MDWRDELRYWIISIGLPIVVLYLLVAGALSLATGVGGVWPFLAPVVFFGTFLVARRSETGFRSVRSAVAVVGALVLLCTLIWPEAQDVLGGVMAVHPTLVNAAYFILWPLGMSILLDLISD